MPKAVTPLLAALRRGGGRFLAPAISLMRFLRKYNHTGYEFFEARRGGAKDSLSHVTYVRTPFCPKAVFH
jgi:hypothetical protein